ncbi:MAG: rhomboid family intramembrane serine protease [Phycisphaerae bacterium]|nr:rhomboid family intramembrane serine protease [Phycisphaerae bacterium]
MIFIFTPYEVDVPEHRTPVINYAIIGFTIFAFISTIGPVDYREFVLNGWDAKGVLGHLFLHADIFHLAGNMLFLWVFGNAVCSKLGNVLYLPVYLLLGTAAAIASLSLNSIPAIGASGAINGIVGMYLVFFPINSISCFLFVWFFFKMHYDTYCLDSFWIILLYFAFDIWGIVSGSQGVGYSAHIGGFAAGIILAILMLKFNIVKMEDTEKSLLAVLHLSDKSIMPKLSWHRKNICEHPQPRRLKRFINIPVEDDPFEYDDEPTENMENKTKRGDSFVNPDKILYFKCKCGKVIKISSSHSGKTGKCPRCQQKVRIPYECKVT